MSRDREFEALIKPFMEKRICQCLKIAMNEDLPLFHQKTRINSLHPEDRLKIDPAEAKPVFSFDRIPEKPATASSSSQISRPVSFAALMSRFCQTNHASSGPDIKSISLPISKGPRSNPS
jgi:hypothetical protein